MSEIGALVLQIGVITLTIIFFAWLIGSYIYKKSKGLPTGECANCHKGTAKLLKEYRKVFPK